MTVERCRGGYRRGHARCCRALASASSSASSRRGFAITRPGGARAAGSRDVRPARCARSPNPANASQGHRPDRYRRERHRGRREQLRRAVAVAALALRRHHDVLQEGRREGGRVRLAVSGSRRHGRRRRRAVCRGDEGRRQRRVRVWRSRRTSSSIVHSRDRWAAKLAGYETRDEAKAVALRLAAWNVRSFVLQRAGKFELWYGGKKTEEDIQKTWTRSVGADELKAAVRGVRRSRTERRASPPSPRHRRSRSSIRASCRRS